MTTPNSNELPSEYLDAFSAGAKCDASAVEYWRNPAGGLQFKLQGATFGLVVNEFTELTDAEELGRDAAKYIGELAT